MPPIVLESSVVVQTLGLWVDCRHANGHKSRKWVEVRPDPMKPLGPLIQSAVSLLGEVVAVSWELAEPDDGGEAMPWGFEARN